MSKIRNALLLLLPFFIIAVYLIYQGSQKHILVSPVLGNSKLKIADNIWFPQQTPKVFQAAPEISAEAAYFIETNGGEVLYAKNQNEKLPIASLTKIMTAIITLENKTQSDVLEVSQHASEMEPDKMLLIAGERLAVRELLDGVFLVSANDAAEVLAEKVTGRREEFINLMNAKAAQLGMQNSLFINPTGLEEDLSTSSGQVQKQYSTVFDVALMSRYAIKHWSELVDISSTEHIFLPQTSTHQDYDMYSGINLLTTYPGVVGFKTGYTPEAGLTLVTLARKGGKEVLGVLLGSTDRRDDARALLDYSFKKLGV